MWDPDAPRQHPAARDPRPPSLTRAFYKYPHQRTPDDQPGVTVAASPTELRLSQAEASSASQTTSTMPLQNGGWALEAQQATKQQPAAPARGRRGAVLAVLLLLLRVGALCASAAAAALAASESATLRRAPFRFLLAADAIVAVYSAFEAAAAAWEVARGATLLPEAMQLWFDFGHDQGFGYMALAAAATAARDAAGCGGGREGWTSEAAAACVRADVAVGLGFAGFAFLALAALVTGFRVACFLATGSRFSPPPAAASY